MVASSLHLSTLVVCAATMLMSGGANAAGLRQSILQQMSLADDNNANNTTACVPLNVVTATLVDHDGDGMVSPGDCLKYPAGTSLEGIAQGQVSTAKIPDGSGRIGQFTFNTTCGGLTLTDVLDPSADMSAMPSAQDIQQQAIDDLSCPAGQISARTVDMTSDPVVQARITTTTGRGVGVPVSSCDQYGSNYERDGGLCYPKCASGYTGVGPLCLTNCPSGFRNDGLFCAKPNAYGRGGGSNFGLGSCPRGRERNGLLCYPICRTNFHATGCCICSPDCPSGMTDIGVSCQKGSYNRGVGRPLKCPSGSDYDAGLCYRPCPTGANGVGPLCYAECTDDQPYRLGIWCYHSENERNQILGAIIGGVLGGAVIAGLTAVFIPIIVAGVSAAVAAPLVIVSTGPLTSSIFLVGAIAL